MVFKDCNFAGKVFFNESLSHSDCDVYRRASLNVKEKISGFHSDQPLEFAYESWVIAFVGHDSVAHSKQLKTGDLIRITSCDFHNYYDRDRKKQKPEIRVVKFEIIPDTRSEHCV